VALLEFYQELSNSNQIQIQIEYFNVTEMSTLQESLIKTFKTCKILKQIGLTIPLAHMLRFVSSHLPQDHKIRICRQLSCN